MALLDFPSGPTQDVTTYTNNGNTWKWNGTSWVAFNNLSLSSQVSGILAVQYGGTGFGGTYTKGDILYALSSNTFGKLGAGTAGSVLSIDVSGDLFWKKDDAGSGTVGSGTSGGFAYYTSTTNITSGSGFSYIIGPPVNVVLTNGLLSLIGSTVNSGTWAGNAITAKYGGTGLNAISAGQLIYGSGTDTFTTLSHSGTAGSILVTTGSSGIAWTLGSSLTVGIASSSVLSNITGDTTSTLYLLGSRSSGGFAGTAIYVDSGISALGNTLTATTFVGALTGTATTATRALNTDITLDTTSQIFLTGSRSNSSIGSTPTYVLSGVSALGNTVTATTFVGSLTGTASIATSSLLSNTTTDTSSTLYILGSRSSTGFAGTAIYVDSSLSVVGNTITGNLTGTASIASSSVLSNITGDTTSTIYLLGSRSSGGFAGTAIYVDSGISALGNTLTATTFVGALTGTASIASSSVLVNTTADTSNTLYLLGTRTNGGFAGTGIFVDNSIFVVGNTITANLTGTATTATRALNTDITGDTSNQIFLTGSRSSSSIGSTPTYVLSGVSALGNTVTATTFVGALTGTASIATSSVLVNTTADTSNTLYLLGTRTNGGFAGTGIFVDNSIFVVGNTITATTFSGNLSGTAVTATHYGSGINLSGIVTSLAGSTGISVNSATGAVTVTNTGVISLTGTANQVLVAGGSGSATSGNITLTLPQSIATTSSPSFADITITTGSNSTLATVGSSATSIVNKQYVDNLASGLDVHGSVRLVSIAAIGASYYQPNYGIGNTATGAYLTSIGNATFPAIDGVTIGSTGVNQRVLIAGGLTGTGKTSINGSALVTPANSNLVNGIYYVGSVGSGSSQWYLYRATDTDDNTELTGGTFTFVEEGASYADSGFVCTNDTTNFGPIQFGSTAITFSQFTGGGALSAGQGLTKVGNTIAAKVNLFSTGTASGTGFSQFNIGGASAGGVADTGYYPTFSVRTSGTTVSGSAILTLNSDGFSLIGSTNNSRTITVTGSDITLTGGGNTLTLTGNISLPTPQQYRLAYGLSGTAISFLPVGGASSVLFQTNNSSDPIWVGQSTLSVGNASIASSSVLSNITGDTTSTLYLLGSKSSGGFAGTAIYVDSGVSALGNTLTATTFVGALTGTASIASSSVLVNTTADTSSTLYLLGTKTNGGFAGTGIFVDNSIFVVGNTITANLTGTATTATRALNTDITGDTTNQIFLTGSRSNASIGSTPTYVLSGVSALGNTITATTFVGALTGTASIASSSVLSNITGDTTSTIYLLGSRSSGGFAGTAIYVDSGISALGNTLTATTFVGALTGTASIASSSVLVNTTADTSNTLYLLGTKTNGGFAGTGIFVDNSIFVVGNTMTANLTGTATTATRALNTDITGDTTNQIFLTGSRSNASIGSTPTYVLSGVSALGNTVTATTFVGALTGTASIASSSVLSNITGDTTSTIYLLGSRSSGGFAGTAIYVDSGISALGNTLTATTFVGALTGTATTATRALNTDITGDTSSQIFLTGSRSNASIGSTPTYVLSGVSALGNTVTATTFVGALTGIATSSTRVGITTNITSSDFPIVFSDVHAPYASLGSSTLLTYNPSNGKITNGIWAGTAITTGRGGTGLNTVNANQLLIGASTGNTWATIGSSVVPVVAIGAAAPAQPGGAIGATQAGQLWWDSEYGVLKVYYVDATPTAQWVDATPVLGSSGGGSSTKRSYVMTFGAGFTPSTGADTVQILIPYAPDNTSKYYYIKRLDYRANTAGTGVSFYMERFTGGNAAFDVATGNRIHSGAGASFVASSGTFTTSYTQSSTGASFVSSSGVAGSVISGDYLRLNFSHINSAATMSVSIILEEQ